MKKKWFLGKPLLWLDENMKNAPFVFPAGVMPHNDRAEISKKGYELNDSFSKELECECDNTAKK